MWTQTCVRRPYQCCRSHRADPEEPLAHSSCILYTASIIDTPGQQKVGRKIGSLNILGSQTLDLRIGTFFIQSVPCRVTFAVKGTGIIRIKSRRKRTTYDIGYLRFESFIWISYSFKSAGIDFRLRKTDDVQWETGGRMERMLPAA